MHYFLKTNDPVIFVIPELKHFVLYYAIEIVYAAPADNDFDLWLDHKLRSKANIVG